MAGERLLLDTVFIQALLNRNDQYHAQASAFLPTVGKAGMVWITEADGLGCGLSEPKARSTPAVRSERSG